MRALRLIAAGDGFSLSQMTVCAQNAAWSTPELPQEYWVISMEIITLTLFDSVEAIKRFADDDYGREHVMPSARAVLLGSDPVIRHFDVMTSDI